MLVGLPDGRRLIIEYDGSYWHSDKADVDREKSLDLLDQGYWVVRIRESPLPSLEVDSNRYSEVKVYPNAQDPEEILQRIAGLRDDEEYPCLVQGFEVSCTEHACVCYHHEIMQTVAVLEALNDGDEGVGFGFVTFKGFHLSRVFRAVNE